MSRTWSSERYELTDLPLLKAAIRSSTYLQYLSYGVDLSDEGNPEFRTLVASELMERIEAEAESVETLRGLGSSGEEFAIEVMRWGSIYFVNAGELDRIGYFLAPDDARAEALHIAACFPVEDDDDANHSALDQARPNLTIRAWYTSDLMASYGNFDDPVGDQVISVAEETLQRICAGDEVNLTRPWFDQCEGQEVRASWRFNMRGPGSASIWLSREEDEEPEIYEVTMMQFGEDPAIYPAPPIFEE